MRLAFRTIFFISTIFLVGQPLVVSADVADQQRMFFVDTTYDVSKRSEVTATLRKITPQFYFYIENDWWNGLGAQEANAVLASLFQIAVTFERDVYPSLTGLFGYENTPGIDRDTRITVLVHPMREDVRGYINTADGFSRLEAPRSNEREMVYFNGTYVTSSFAISYLAHEYMHLIYLNQKDILRGVDDDVWIQEAFSELAPLVTKDRDQEEQDYLAKRVRDFITNPRDSLTEWRNTSVDYGVVSMFFEYFREQYGLKVLQDTMSSSKKGIDAFNEALLKNGFKDTFADVFQNWVVAMFLNDCSYGKQFCMTAEAVKQLRVAPYTSFLPAFGTSELSFSSQTKEWAGNWYKVSGGPKGQLEFVFDGNGQARFKVPYLLEKAGGTYELRVMTINSAQHGSIIIPRFGDDVTALILMPFIEGRNTGFTSTTSSYFFSWRISVTSGASQGSGEGDATNAQIEALLSQIARLRSQLAALQSGAAPVSCQALQSNLFFGMKGSNEVRCLQQELKQADVYPEGYVTGTFGQLTQAAVIRFQEKYRTEILAPFGLTQGTGYVGPATRSKLNQLFPH
ncbi:MAG: peptidoglycan-binding domain-containing protein [bacterium]|nr:peptidoglycan-binding domain-containing protein [bacterium]